MKEVRFITQVQDALEAFLQLQEELRKVRTGETQQAAPMMTFSAFAAQLFDDKVKGGDIRSASGRVKWAQTLEHHLLPAFGPMLLDRIRHVDVAAWRVKVAEKINDGTYSPFMVNGWLNILRMIAKAAVVHFELPRNRLDGIKNFDTSEHGYTEEELNSLTVEEVPRFLSKLRELYPQHFAFVCLGSFWGTGPRRCGLCAGRDRPRTFCSTRGSSTSGNRTRRVTR